MKKTFFFALLPVVGFLVADVAQAAPAWPNGPYINYSAYWENKDMSAIQVRDVWKYADVMGFDKANFDRAVQASLTVESLEQMNANLRRQVDDLESRLRILENRSPAVPLNTTIVQEADMSRVTSLEKRVSVLEQVISMLEVNIGSIHARIDQLLAPVFKRLGL